MRILATLLLLGSAVISFAQSATLRGTLHAPDGESVPFSNVLLFDSTDSTMVKAAATTEAGFFEMKGISEGNYFLKASYLGFDDLFLGGIQIKANQQLDLGKISFASKSISLAETTITAKRNLVEVKADRTVFNVEGTINSTGSDALALLRKAPGVTVDNNDNVNVLGRSGVLIYVDGKRLPLGAQDLSNYLQSLPADQIDRIDIITNPGAKYEAEGNAGIIDIRLKKDKNLGANGSVNTTFSQGVYPKGVVGANGNYRNKHLNAFGNLGAGKGKGFNRMLFENYLNGIAQDEINSSDNQWRYGDFRAGIDFFVAKNHTVGLLVSGGANSNDNESFNRITLAQEANPVQIDSILVARNSAMNERKRQAYNLNYRFDNNKGRSFNLDLDYGRYSNRGARYQPNRYYDASEAVLLTEIVNSFKTPTDIDIYTLQADYEWPLWGGNAGAGGKLSKVVSDNTFFVFDENTGSPIQDNRRSNNFTYDEKVYAAYLNYARPLNEKWDISAGLRAEQTDANGNLQAFLPELQEPPVDLNYLSWFPSAGITWKYAPQHLFSLNAGRRINRPDYEVLNPFNNQISQLSYEKGNPRLNPEIVNNLELSYTLGYKYNFKLAYSRTTNQITRLIAPADDDPRAGYITWDNLAERRVIGFNASAPVDITKKWNAYFNFSASHIDNRADYGDGAVINVQAFTYSIFQQHTFTLPWKLKAEVSGYYSGPGVWGGVFIYEPNWSLDLGLQRKFFDERLQVRLNASDLFYKSGWKGVSEFNGLTSKGSGRWDSRRGSINLNYLFGNQNVKSRKRSTGLESEAGRVGQ